MTTAPAHQWSEPHVKIIAASDENLKQDGLRSVPSSSGSVAKSCAEHMFSATASLKGIGQCKAWIIKPDQFDARDDSFEGLGSEDSEDLMHEVFDWPASRTTPQTLDKGVKFLQQFDTSYDYLEEDSHDIRDNAWIVLIRHVHVEQGQRRHGYGTSLVRAVLQEIIRRAQLERRLVLAFVKWKGLKGRRDDAESKARAAFWEDLGFERVNDGHLFPRSLDWLAWSPRTRGSAALFERPRAFPIEFNALIEGHLGGCG